MLLLLLFRRRVKVERGRKKMLAQHRKEFAASSPRHSEVAAVVHLALNKLRRALDARQTKGAVDMATGECNMTHV